MSRIAHIAGVVFLHSIQNFMFRTMILFKGSNCCDDLFNIKFFMKVFLSLKQTTLWRKNVDSKPFSMKASADSRCYWKSDARI